jgi:hypothetical protein
MKTSLTPEKMSPAPLQQRRAPLSDRLNDRASPIASSERAQAPLKPIGVLLLRWFAGEADGH